MLDAAGVDEIMGRVQSGTTISRICRDTNVRREVFYMWLDARDLRPRFAAARKESAAALVDEAIDGLEDATPEDISVRREQAKYKTWFAGKLDRDSFGEATRVTHSVELGASFVEMMRGRGQAQAIEQPRARIESVGSTQQPVETVLVPRNTSPDPGD